MIYDKAFLKAVVKAVEEKVGKDYMVNIQNVIKNNDVRCCAILIGKCSERTAPLIYLEPYYDEYLDDGELGNIADRIIGEARKCPTEEIPNTQIFDFGENRDSITLRLVNREKNAELLEDVPSIPVLGDLSAVFYISIRNEEQRVMQIRVTKMMAAIWKKTPAELYTLAVQNTQRLFPEELKSMDEICKMLKDEDMDDACMPEMYILSNTRNLNGATVILYPDILKNIANKFGKDFVIIPSSIHEVLLVLGDREQQNFEEIQHMIHEVNATQVPPNEVLSESVYFYDRQADTVTRPLVDVA
jgi:hypothetical protein